jgi:Rho-binding antiterminator
MTDYTPIDCGIHSEYELAIIQRKPLRVSWRDAHGRSHIAVVLPVDLVTRDHAEYLIARNEQQQQLELRLDDIVNSEAL